MGWFFFIMSITALLGCGTHGESPAFNKDHIKGYAIHRESFNARCVMAKNDINNRIYVSNIDLTVIVDIGCWIIIITHNDINYRIYIGDCNLTISIHITINICRCSI